MAALTYSLKRRKLSNASSFESQTHAQALITPKIITASNVKSIPNPTCVSCHRSLNSTQGYLILCTRCSMPTCVVCSRTCTASDSSTASLYPPITSSQSLSTTSSSRSSSTWPSPRRVALALTSTTNTPPPLTSSPTNITSPQVQTLGKRRKSIEEEVPTTSNDIGAGGQENLGRMGGANNSFAGAAEQKSAEKTSISGPQNDALAGPGCGRTVCRNCCSEDSKQSTVTCHDCSLP